MCVSKKLGELSKKNNEVNCNYSEIFFYSRFLIWIFAFLELFFRIFVLLENSYEKWELGGINAGVVNVLDAGTSSEWSFDVGLAPEEPKEVLSLHRTVLEL